MSENQISFLLTKDEKKLLNDQLLLDPEFEEIIDNAEEEDGQFRLEISEEDLDEGLNSLAACANHAASKRAQKKSDDLFEKLSRYLTLIRNMNKQ
ncbi:MAG: hypothetical protein K8S27_05295 [Candidatus Omnitrophica bacterium]|nr:hypothetical protein [Candidatus Omnitrophota bacterium]